MSSKLSFVNYRGRKFLNPLSSIGDSHRTGNVIRAYVAVDSLLAVMSNPRHRCRLTIFADYHQFYVWNPKKSGQHAPEDWSNQDVINRAKIVPGVVVICPVRNMAVPVEVGIWDSEPRVIFGAWQHVIEAPLATDGLIEIHECTGGSHACFSVEPGDYTVRGLYRGLDTLSEDGFEGKDFYEIQIWRSPCPDLRIIRQWSEG